jgi:hypothetical protein
MLLLKRISARTVEAYFPVKILFAVYLIPLSIPRSASFGWMINEQCVRTVNGRKRSWVDLKCYTGIHVEGLRKTTKYLSEDIRSPDRDLNPRPREFEGAGMLPHGLDVRPTANETL